MGDLAPSSEGAPDRSARWRLLASALAVLVTLGVVGGLVYYRLSSGPPGLRRVGDVAVAGIDFKCRLPVLGGAAAGFISFPDGSISLDRSVTMNVYKGAYGFTYDAVVGKWLPVPRSALSPDGRSYAYMAQTTGVPGQSSTMSLRTHEIVSGKDRVLWEGQGSPMGPTSVTWLPGGIYFTAFLIPSDASQGPPFPAVYLADPNHPGAPRRVGPNPPPQFPSPGEAYNSGPNTFNLVGSGAAWGTGNRVMKEAPTPTNGPPPLGTYGPDRVLRMDLRDGSVSTWYTVAGTDMVSLVSLDAQGRPIVSLFTPKPPPVDKSTVYVPPPPRLLLLTGAGQTIDITAGAPDFHLGGMLSADSHGIWFGSWNALWLYTQSAGLRQVATIPSGVFPSPSPPPGIGAKPVAVPSGGGPALPSYMQGTLVIPAGPCN